MDVKEHSIRQLQRSLWRLKKAEAVQQEFQKHYHEGIKQKWVYNTYIKDSFFIGYRTFREYLGISVNVERRVINERIKQIENEINDDSDNDSAGGPGHQLQHAR